MSRFTSDPCPRCRHVASGKERQTSTGMAVPLWDPPPPECGCICHEAWRMGNQTPAAEAAA